MKNCPNCGYQLDDDATFCVNCGAKVDQPSDAPVSDNAETTTTQWPTFEQAEQNAARQEPGASNTTYGGSAGYTAPPQNPNPTPGYNAYPNQPPVNGAYQNGAPYAPYGSPQPPKKKHTGLIVALVIVGVIVLAIIGGIIALVAGVNSAVNDYDSSFDTGVEDTLPSTTDTPDTDTPDTSTGLDLLDETTYLTKMTTEVLGLGSVMDSFSTYVDGASSMDDLNTAEFMGYLDSIDTYCNNILALTPPAGYEAAHSVLVDGLNDVLTGTSYVRSAVNENDPALLNTGAEYFISASEKITQWEEYLPE